MVFLKEFFETVDFEKKETADHKKHAQLPSRQRVKDVCHDAFKMGENDSITYCIYPTRIQTCVCKPCKHRSGHSEGEVLSGFTLFAIP